MQGLEQSPPSAAVIAKDPPVLEPSNGMFDAGPAPTMPAPASISGDAPPDKHGGDELGDASVATICEYTPMPSTAPLDLTTAVVNRIVSIAWSPACDREHPQISAAHEDLRIA